MAELNTEDKNAKGGKVRSKKQNSKVDLTAMVDLAFLLITFFMLTTSLSKPHSMDLALPDKEKDPKTDKPIKVDENRTLTIIMGANNKMIYYVGMLATPIVAPKEIAYGKDGIRKELLSRKKLAADYVINKGDTKNEKEVDSAGKKKEKGLIVIIKPGKKSTYKNFVDILDEMAIVKVPAYAVVNEMDEAEKKLIEKF